MLQETVSPGAREFLIVRGNTTRRLERKITMRIKRKRNQLNEREREFLIVRGNITGRLERKITMRKKEKKSIQ